VGHLDDAAGYITATRWLICSTTPRLGDEQTGEPEFVLQVYHLTEAIMEQDPPVLPVAWEQINDVCYNNVKGHNPYDYFGIYDIVREDTFRLDNA
jgi:hypothetical protein